MRRHPPQALGAIEDELDLAAQLQQIAAAGGDELGAKDGGADVRHVLGHAGLALQGDFAGVPGRCRNGRFMLHGAFLSGQQKWMILLCRVGGLPPTR